MLSKNFWCSWSYLLKPQKNFWWTRNRKIKRDRNAIARDRAWFANFFVLALEPSQIIAKAPKFRLTYTTTWLNFCIEQIFNNPHRFSQLFFAHFWRNFSRDYYRTNRARLQKKKKNPKILEKWGYLRNQVRYEQNFFCNGNLRVFLILSRKNHLKKLFTRYCGRLFLQQVWLNSKVL